jgi:hypothetical protein
VINLLNLSVPPNVLLPVPAAAAVVAVAPPPLLVLGLFVVFLLPVVFFFTANVEAVILPAVTSAIAVTITKMLIALFLYADRVSMLHSYYRFCSVVDWTDEFYKPYIQY